MEIRKIMACGVCTAVFLMGIVTAANATKIGVVNVQEIAKSKTLVKLRANLNSDLKKKLGNTEQEVQKLEQKLQNAKQRFKQASLAMTVAQFKEFLQEDARLSQAAHIKSQKIFLANKKSFDVLTKKVNTIISDFANKNNFDLIIKKESAVFYKDSIDVTADLIKTLGNQ